MNLPRKLLSHVERLDCAAGRNRILFGPIISHIQRFRRLLLDSPEGLAQGELLLLARAIERFFDKWRPPRTNSSAVYIPPGEIAELDWTAREISALAAELARLSEAEFRRLAWPSKSEGAKKGRGHVRRSRAALPEKPGRRIGFSHPRIVND